MSELRISDYYKAFPRQEQFHQSNAKNRLFGGQAGPGKTKALLWEAIFQANHYPGVDTLLLRRTFPELEESLLREFRRSVPQELYKSYNESKHVVIWHNGSTTRFGHAQNENDVYQYQGAEYLFIGIDELTMFTLPMWQFLSSRNRCPVPGTFPNMAGATNPGSIGHKWVKALWIDRKPADNMEESFRYNPDEYEFIPARLDDNEIYAVGTQAGDAYRSTLESLPEHMRRMYLEGDWNIFAGQYFDFFGKQCTIPAEEVKLERWHTRWISMDWGYKHPASVYWHAINENKVVTTYREIHGDMIGERELARRIVEENAGEKVEAIFLSPDAFAKRTSQNTIAEEMGDELRKEGLPFPTPADNNRIGGARLCHSMLKGGFAFISTACPMLIDCLPSLIHDDKNVEDVLKVDAAPGTLGDDPYDAWRYGLLSMLGAKAVPFEEKVKRFAAEIDDPTNRAIAVQKMFADMRKRRANDGKPAHSRLRWAQGRN